MGWISSDVTNGIVSGVAAGIVLTVFFAAIDHIRTHAKRTDQIRYLSTLISDYRGKILDVREDIPHPTDGDPITVHQQRKLLHNQLLRQLDSALSGRTSELTYDEVESVRSVFWSAYNRLLGDKLWPEERYLETFKRAESIKWLGLSAYASKGR